MKQLRKNNDELALAVPPSASNPLTVTEIKADPDFVFEPWFRSQRVSYQIRALKSVPEWRVWTTYFEKWGCLVCGTKQRSHASLGMCNVCSLRTRNRLSALLAPHIDCGEPQTFTFDNEEVAQQALAKAYQAFLVAAGEDPDGNT